MEAKGELRLLLSRCVVMAVEEGWWRGETEVYDWVQTAVVLNVDLGVLQAREAEALVVHL